MPFKNQRQRAACEAADDPNWDCEKYAKGEDNEDTFNGAVSDVLKRVDDKITVEDNEERVRLTLDSPGTASVHLPKGDPRIQKYLDKGYKVVKDYKKAEQNKETFDEAVARYLIKKD